MRDKIKYWFIRIGLTVILLDLMVAAAVLIGVWYYGR